MKSIANILVGRIYELPVNKTLPNSWLIKTPLELAQLGSFELVHWPLAEHKCVDVYVKRDDMIDPFLGGNKLYKLHGHLKHFLTLYGELEPSQRPFVVSFGGAYSNHLYALAEACRRENIQSIGIIRGEKPVRMSDTLKDVQNAGMTLHFVSRTQYHDKNTRSFRQNIESIYGECFWIEEGGGGVHGLSGCIGLGESLAEFASACRNNNSHANDSRISVCLACGTATTLSGVMSGIAQFQNLLTNSLDYLDLIGISALKSRSSLVRAIYTQTDKSITDKISWQLNNDFHFGGFAKTNNVLKDFAKNFYKQTSVPLDLVYNAKLFWAIDTLLRQDYWASGSTVIALHSGGLQGNRGFK